jgi:hypothetical protein
MGADKEVRAIADELAAPGLTTGRLADLVARLREISQRLAEAREVRGLGWGQ